MSLGTLRHTGRACQHSQIRAEVRSWAYLLKLAVLLSQAINFNMQRSPKTMLIEKLAPIDYSESCDFEDHP